MGYKDQVKAQKKSGKGKAISTELVKWEKPGDGFIGKFLSMATLESTQKENATYKQFMFHTDDGYKKCAFGFRGEEYATQFTPGYIYEVEYLGKIELEGGRRMNDFRITEFVVETVGQVGGEDDIPF